MNRDVAEVNGSDPPMLPGSFLYEKEPGYEARLFSHSILQIWDCYILMRVIYRKSNHAVMDHQWPRGEDIVKAVRATSNFKHTYY